MKIDYEEADTAANYAYAHYSNNDHYFSLLESIIEEFHQGQRQTALDLGCAVGGLTFRLGEKFEDVSGVDLSQSFIDVAEKLRVDSQLSQDLPLSCGKPREETFYLPNNCNSARVNFQESDAESFLTESKHQFDLIAAIHLICRVPRPFSLLKNIQNRLSDSGSIILATPHSWDKNRTANEDFDCSLHSQHEINRMINEMLTSVKLVYKTEEYFNLRIHDRLEYRISSEISVYRKH